MNWPDFRISKNNFKYLKLLSFFMDYCLSYKPDLNRPPYYLPDKLRKFLKNIGELEIISEIYTDSPIIIVSLPEEKAEEVKSLEGVIDLTFIPKIIHD